MAKTEKSRGMIAMAIRHFTSIKKKMLECQGPDGVTLELLVDANLPSGSSPLSLSLMEP